MTEPLGPNGPPSPDVGEPSGLAKLGAAIAGFLSFYGLGLMLLRIVASLEIIGAVVAVAIVIAVLVWLSRALRGNDARTRSTTRWFALGFAAATAVFGGCLMLLSGL